MLKQWWKLQYSFDGISWTIQKAYALVGVYFKTSETQWTIGKYIVSKMMCRYSEVNPNFPSSNSSWFRILIIGSIITIRQLLVACCCLVDQPKWCVDLKTISKFELQWFWIISTRRLPGDVPDGFAIASRTSFALSSDAWQIMDIYELFCTPANSSGTSKTVPKQKTHFAFQRKLIMGILCSPIQTCRDKTVSSFY